MKAHPGPWVRCGEDLFWKALGCRHHRYWIIPSTLLQQQRAAAQWWRSARLSAGEATGIAKAAANRWLGARHPTGLRAHVS